MRYPADRIAGTMRPLLREATDLTLPSYRCRQAGGRRGACR